MLEAAMRVHGIKGTSITPEQNYSEEKAIVQLTGQSTLRRGKFRALFAIAQTLVTTPKLESVFDQEVSDRPAALAGRARLLAGRDHRRRIGHTMKQHEIRHVIEPLLT